MSRSNNKLDYGNVIVNSQLNCQNDFSKERIMYYAVQQAEQNFTLQVNIAVKKGD